MKRLLIGLALLAACGGDGGDGLDEGDEEAARNPRLDQPGVDQTSGGNSTVIVQDCSGGDGGDGGDGAAGTNSGNGGSGGPGGTCVGGDQDASDDDETVNEASEA